MKTTLRIFFFSGWFIFFALHTTETVAQASNPQSSAKSSAQYDAQCIANNIEDIQDILFFSALAMERAGDTRTREVAQSMYTDYTTILYAMEQLASAGYSSSENNKKKTGGGSQETADLNAKLSESRGLNFDTLWMSNLVALQQSTYDELTQQKVDATNSQLKASVTEAIPVVRRYVNQLRSLQKLLSRMMLQEKKEAEKSKKINH